MATRYTAYLGSTVTLYTYFYFNGTLADIFSPGTVTIYRPDDSVLISGVVPTHDSTGIYSIDIVIASGEATGVYTDSWINVKYASDSTPITINNSFYVGQPFSSLPTPDMAEVYDYIYRSDGQAMEDVYGYLKIIELPENNGTMYFNPTEPGFKTYSDAAGRIQWLVPVGATFIINIPDIGYYSGPKTIGATGSYQIKDL